MDVPCRGILESAAFQEDVLAFTDRDHDRPEERLYLGGVEARVRIVEVARGRACLLVPLVGEPDVLLVGEYSAVLEDFLPYLGRGVLFLDFAPGVAASVDDPLSGDGDVPGPVGIDGGEAPVHVQAFEVGLYDGIEVPVGAEDNDSPFFQVQVYVVQQSDRPREPHPLRNDDMAASLSTDVGDRGRKSLGVEGYPVPDGAELDDAGAPLRNGRSLDPGHVERQAFVEVCEFIGRLSAATECQCEQRYPYNRLYFSGREKGLHVVWLW